MTRQRLVCRFLGHVWRRDGNVIDRSPSWHMWFFFDACTRCGKVRPVTP